MEYPQFLSVDDLEEKDRDEIRRILYGPFEGRKIVLELSITLENLNKARKSEPPGNVLVGLDCLVQNASSAPFLANFNPGVPPTFRLATPFMYRAVTEGGAPIHTIPPPGPYIPGQPYPILVSASYPGQLMAWPFAIPPTAFPAPTAAAATPFHPNVAPSNQTSLQHTAIQTGPAGQSCRNGGPDAVCASVAENQVPAAAEGESVSSPPPPDTMEDEVNTEPRNEDKDMPRIISSDGIPNAGSDASPTKDVGGQETDQKVDLTDRSNVQNGSTNVNGDGPKKTEDSIANAQAAAEDAQASQKSEDVKPTKEEKTWASLFRNTPTAKGAIVTKVLSRHPKPTIR